MKKIKYIKLYIEINKTGFYEVANITEGLNIVEYIYATQQPPFAVFLYGITKDYEQITLKYDWNITGYIF